MIAAIDKKLTEQVNVILHHEDFQKLESAWRGLHYLVNNTETDEMLKIRVMNISKKELGKTLKKYKGTAWDQSPLFKKLYEEEYGQFGGEPFGCLVGDYHFDHSPPDVELLGEMAKIAAAAHAPFIAGAGADADADGVVAGAGQPARPDQDLHARPSTRPGARCASPRTRATSAWPCRASWRACPTAPRPTRSRSSTSRKTRPAPTTASTRWANAAYAMAVNINRSFKLYGWCSRIRGIESGGAVEGLPTHTFPTDDGGVDMKCPTEIAISDRREAELAKNGFMPLDPPQEHRLRRLHRRAVAAEAGRVRRPRRDRQRQPGGAPALPVRDLPLRALPEVHRARQDRLVQGARRHADAGCNNWIMQVRRRRPGQLVRSRPRRSKPLAAAEVVVEEVEGNPGYYTSKFFLRPHYQLEGLTVSLRLVSKLPSAKAA